MGLSQQWIVGEASYDDSTEAAALSSLDSANQKINFLCQWPLNTSGASVPPPLVYNNYLAYGY